MSALAIENSWGASVYAPKIRKPRTAEAVSMDIFARRERSIPVMPQRHQAIERVIQIGSQYILLTTEDNLPIWFEPVINSMSERWGASPGWDSYEARPTDSNLAIKLLNYLSEIMPDEAVPPIITPLADGGLQAEWHRGNKDIEVVVPYNEPARYYYFDAATDQEEEEELSQQHIGRLRAHINSL